MYVRMHACMQIFGDVGWHAAGAWGRNLVFVVTYIIDSTRCIVMHLAASQSLEHVFPERALPLWACGLIVSAPVLGLGQVTIC